MKIYRRSNKVVITEVSDLAAKIACELHNKHLINRRYMDMPPYDDMSREQKSFFLVEEVSIVIDKILKQGG